MARLSVTVVNFADWSRSGPAARRQRGHGFRAAAARSISTIEVWYDEPNIGGRQFQVALADGRALRGSAYMADHRLYITEAVADLNDFSAFLFEQSVSLIDDKGVDLDSNPVNLAVNGVGTSAGLPNRQYDCSRLNRRR